MDYGPKDQVFRHGLRKKKGKKPDVTHTYTYAYTYVYIMRYEYRSRRGLWQVVHVERKKKKTKNQKRHDSRIHICTHIHNEVWVSFSQRTLARSPRRKGKKENQKPKKDMTQVYTYARIYMMRCEYRSRRGLRQENPRGTCEWQKKMAQGKKKTSHVYTCHLRMKIYCP